MEPAEQIKDAHEYEKVFEEEMKVEAIVYADRPKAAFTLRLTQDMKIEIVEKKVLPPEEAWTFTYQYLKRAVEHPENYIENPAKLEWGWLKPVLGSA